MLGKQWRTGVLLASAALAFGCTSTGSSGSTTVPANDDGPAVATNGTIPTGILPGYPTDVDQISPLVITTISPAPIPFTGTDNRVHVVYELQVVNASPRTATLKGVEVLDGGPDGKV